MSIIATVITVGIIATSAAGIAESPDAYYYYSPYYHHSYDSRDRYSDEYYRQVSLEHEFAWALKILWSQTHKCVQTVKVFKSCWKYAGDVYTSPAYFQQPFEHFNHLNALITIVA